MSPSSAAVPDGTDVDRTFAALADPDRVDGEPPPFDARVRVYSLRAASMQGLRSWLADTEAGWVRQLAAFKDHVEGG